MEAKIIQKIIEDEIPIVKSMGVKFIDFGHDSCIISVPLEPNHNHKNTVFGGSLYSVCTSACYGILFALQLEDKLEHLDLVIGEGSIRYIKPVDKDFKVRAELNSADWKRLKEKVQITGFSKIQLTAFVFADDETHHLCEYKATFILMNKRG